MGGPGDCVGALGHGLDDLVQHGVDDGVGEGLGVILAVEQARLDLVGRDPRGVAHVVLERIVYVEADTLHFGDDGLGRARRSLSVAGGSR